VNRFKISLPGRRRAVTARVVLAGLVAFLAALLSGCGAGQVSQMAVQNPAINGNKATFNNVALRDVRVQATQTGDFIQPGRTVELVLVAVNQSPDTPDKLVGITSDIGSVMISGDTRLPAAGMLFIGTPEGQKVAPGPVGSNNTAAKATITLSKPISNGLLYNFTFNFEKAGQATLQVPISAGLEQPPSKSEHA
jgi:copper(I)-binding protein